MTDEQINRAVAEKVMGLTIDEANDDIDPWDAYTTDPAAWGALLVWLAGEGRAPDLCHFPIDEHTHRSYWDATVSYSSPRVDGAAAFDWDAPGRALCLAALRAYGVEGL